MERKTESFGEYIKQKRLSHQPRLTLKKTAELLEMNLTYLSDVENGRKKAFPAEKIELFADKLGLSEVEKSEMYDLAARDSSTISEDIKEPLMYTSQGDYARKALRLVAKGKGNDELWKDLIRKMEEDN